MTYSLNRTLGLAVATLALAACISAAPAILPANATTPFGIDLGPSTRVAQPSSLQLADDGHDDAHGTGIVNAIDPGKRTINLSQAIRGLGWPAMTMDFPVTSSVDLKLLKPGAHVDFTLGKGAEGLYQIEAVEPASAGR